MTTSIGGIPPLPVHAQTVDTRHCFLAARLHLSLERFQNRSQLNVNGCRTVPNRSDPLRSVRRTSGGPDRSRTVIFCSVNRNNLLDQLSQAFVCYSRRERRLATCYFAAIRKYKLMKVFELRGSPRTLRALRIRLTSRFCHYLVSCSCQQQSVSKSLNS